MSFEFFLENVSDPTGHLSAVDFYEISDLSPEELGQFASAWYPLSIDEIAARRIVLISLRPFFDCKFFFI